MFKNFIFVFFSSSLIAAPLRPSPCHVGFQAELLYFIPNYEQQNFVVDIQDSDFVRSNRPKFKAGFRVEGVWGLDCVQNLSARFTYFSPVPQTARASGTLFSTNTRIQPNAEATSTLSFYYNSFEALYGRWLYDCCDFNLTFQTGLFFSQIDCDDSFVLTSPPRTTPPAPASLIDQSRSSFWGLGPQVAVNFSYPLPLAATGKWALMGNVHTALLASKLSTKTQFNLINGGVGGQDRHIRGSPLWRTTPVIDAGFGLSWDFCCRCSTMHAEIGYEWIWYRGAVSKLVLFNGSLPFSRDTVFFNTRTLISNISFQGPYAAFGVAF